MNNAIKHAYGNDAGHEVEVIFTFCPDRITLDICDFGRTMEPRGKPFLNFDSGDLDSLPECGKGLFIINGVMDEVNYKSYQGKNILTITKFFQSHSK